MVQNMQGWHHLIGSCGTTGGQSTNHDNGRGDSIDQAAFPRARYEVMGPLVGFRGCACVSFCYVVLD